jgi:hypothetical protein
MGSHDGIRRVIEPVYAVLSTSRKKKGFKAGRIASQRRSARFGHLQRWAMKFFPNPVDTVDHLWPANQLVL